MKTKPFVSTAALLLVAFLVTPVPVEAQGDEVSVRDFLSLGIFSQVVREYYLMPESIGEYWRDSTRVALQWTYNALFDCGASSELQEQVEDLRKLILSKRRSQTLDDYFVLEEAIYNFVDSDSIARSAYECGSCLGQLRFYLPRFMEEEDDLKKELFAHLAEDPCVSMKRDLSSWEPMIRQYYSRTQGNPLEKFLGYLKDTGNLPVQTTAEELKKELVPLLEDAARVIADF